VRDSSLVADVSDTCESYIKHFNLKHVQRYSVCRPHAADIGEQLVLCCAAISVLNLPAMMATRSLTGRDRERATAARRAPPHSTTKMSFSNTDTSYSTESETY
jgi:hypothetical protein